jgi:hypothetical protein
LGYTKLNLFYEALNAFGKEYAMADTKNELINEEDQGMLITLEDENGQEVEFEFLDVIEFEGTEYIVLIENDEDADEVVILQIHQIDEDTEEYVSIDDEDTLNKVFELFKKKYEGDINFE